MANFRVHVTTSTVLGGIYALAGASGWNLDWGQALMAASLCAVGGMMPDFDSDSGIPVRHLFGVAGMAAPLLLMPRLLGAGFSLEKALMLGALAYFVVRYALSSFFKRFTVHRGMFHSIPAMLIAGLVVFHLYHHSQLGLRQYMALGTMIGFLSHLVLDEMYSVDLNGLVPRLNKAAGSALKLFSPSWKATAFCYGVLFLLGSSAWWTPGNAAPAMPLAWTKTATPAVLEEAPVHQVIRPGSGQSIGAATPNTPAPTTNPLTPRR
ncbi:MAG: metal-dependent hydrolase [Gemmataceae bacterium]|nr:metal-dependent hydrolase [Gemmataceae bacterium]